MTGHGPILTPLGTSPAWYNPGTAASGYVLDGAGSRVLLDCGSGVISRYLDLFGTTESIDAVVISHVHADHVFDLVPLAYGLTLGSLQHWPTPTLWLPPGAHERLQRLVSTWDGPADFFARAFDLRTYHPEQAFEVGELTVSTIEVPHYIDSYAIRVESGGAAFAYSGDLGPTGAIAPFVSGADLFLCEAAMPEDALVVVDGPAGHLTPGQAGQIARDAGVHSLLLTHIPAENGADAALAAASETYAGPVALAVSGARYSVAGRLAHVS